MIVCGNEMKSSAYISDKEDEIVKCTVCGAIMYYPYSLMDNCK
jgi:predicted  nucleic acid-binding Zn-ribbon protein